MAVASLTAGLLARKGAARPAMRPDTAGDALGWNDFGEGVRARLDVRLPAALSAAELVQDAAEPANLGPDPAAIARAHRTVAAMPPAGRKAFTLRLDAQRHLRLRLACAVERRSAQQLLAAALDRMVAEMPAVERLAFGIGDEGVE